MICEIGGDGPLDADGGDRLNSCRDGRRGRGEGEQKQHPRAFAGHAKRSLHILDSGGDVPVLFLRADEDRLADEEEQEKGRPRRRGGAVGADVAHREAEIVGDEISKAQRHSDAGAKQDLAGPGKAEGGDAPQQRHQERLKADRKSCATGGLGLPVGAPGESPFPPLPSGGLEEAGFVRIDLGELHLAGGEPFEAVIAGTLRTTFIVEL